MLDFEVDRASRFVQIPETNRKLDFDPVAESVATPLYAKGRGSVALTAMMNNREITRERALVIARMVLRDNAVNLYGLTP